MNPFDEIAIEESLKLRESKVAKEVIAITIGPAKSAETLRTALALGVDKAVHVETVDGLEIPPLQVCSLFVYAWLPPPSDKTINLYIIHM